MPDELALVDWIYFRFAEHLGWTPRDVDTLEVWEAALLLGFGTDHAAVAVARQVTLNRGDRA